MSAEISTAVRPGPAPAPSEVHALAALVRRWSRRSPLSAEDQRALLSLPLVRKSFGKDGYIVREGQETHECGLLLRGLAMRQKVVRDGARQIISFHLPTEFIDLQNGLLGVADHNVQSVDRCEIATVPRSAILELIDKYPAVGLAMWIDTLIDASIFREWVINVGRRDARARIAHLLCELALRLKRIGAGENGRFDFPLTQDQLADATGLTSVHTNRTLQSLRRDRLIELNGRSLTILDWDGLCQAGDFDELYLHHQVCVGTSERPRSVCGRARASEYPIIRRLLDNAEQPQDKDQQQDSAKADIHMFLPFSCWC